MTELFTVTPNEEEKFLAAWVTAAPEGATLYRALRSDVPYRYAGLPLAVDQGVVLVVPLAAGFEAAWEAVRDVFAKRQGFLEARLDGDVAIVHWSSPLMYARAVREHGDLIAALPVRAVPALYVRA